jgi:hypothetical protein
MKKAILAPILSAFVIPGLGQIINRRPLKGLIALFLVMLSFVGGLLSFFSSMEDAVATQPDPAKTSFPEALDVADLTVPMCFVGAFALLWLLSVFDAFREGRRLDQRE